MKTKLLLCAALCLARPQEERAEAAVLLDADRAFLAATQERGLDGWMDWFAPDAGVLAYEGEVITGTDAIRAHYASVDFPPAGMRWTPEAAELAESGDLGYSTGSWEYRPPGVAPEEPPLTGRYLTVWRRQPDGAYRVVVDSGGEPDFRTRLTELGGPPREWSSSAVRLETAGSGDLAFAYGTWTARGEEARLEGSFLSVWRGDDDGAWEIASEIGFDR